MRLVRSKAALLQSLSFPGLAAEEGRTGHSVEKGTLMKCPVCPESVLVMADRQGIEIDYCPSCRGVWLDRGELDKLLEKAAGQPGTAAGQQASSNTSRAARPDFVDSDYRHGSGHGYPRRKSWLSDIFD